MVISTCQTVNRALHCLRYRNCTPDQAGRDPNVYEPPTTLVSSVRARPDLHPQTVSNQKDV
jgi:hypothetical protein